MVQGSRLESGGGASPSWVRILHLPPREHTWVSAGLISLQRWFDSTAHDQVVVVYR